MTCNLTEELLAFHIYLSNTEIPEPTVPFKLKFTIHNITEIPSLINGINLKRREPTLITFDT
ncbi:MAG: hypothetical protein DRO46_04880 [Candidatus Hecatellales archaeon]|nr:MAG: hypothetical protein DRO46_04880 [Candidatus Hecatellales archaeon]